VLSLILVLGINALIFSSGWDKASDALPTSPYAPPGYVIGIVWTVLFIGIGASRWFIIRDTGAGRRAAWLPLILAAICLAYPIYTAGLSDRTIALWGNVATAGFAIICAAILYRYSARAAYALMPIPVWIGFATFLILTA
jgi:translocator protein